MDTTQLLKMKPGELISKSELSHLIIDSKRENSAKWLGERYIIHNTPQQGINWIGDFQNPLAVIIKSYKDRYTEDNISGQYRYAFKSRNSIVNKREKANQVLINQKKEAYPILFFKEKGYSFQLVDRFSVESVFDKYVELKLFDVD